MKTEREAPYQSLHLDEIWIREDRKFSGREFSQQLDQLGVKTMAEMLAAMGFRWYAVFSGDRRVTTIDLPVVGRGNVKWAGGGQ